MIPVLSSAGMRAADQFTIERIGIPGRVLMETAGRAAADCILERARTPGPLPAEALVLCGKGNNGGDGLVVARCLAEADMRVRIVMALGSHGLAPDAEANLAVIRALADPRISVIDWDGALPGPSAGPSEAAVLGQSASASDSAARRPAGSAVQTSPILIDALLGTGQRDAPRGAIAEVLNGTEDWPGYRVSLDIPTGLNTDTGAAPGAVFRSDFTIAIAALKLGHLLGVGPDICGEVATVGIGIPASVLETHALEDGAHLVDDAFVRARYPVRARDAHKYHSGPALVVGGSKAYPGAPALAATAAARVGSGYVVAAVPDPDRFSGPVEIPVIKHTDKEDLADWMARAKAVLVGPGLGRDSSAGALVRQVVQTAPKGLVVDADGLRALTDEGLLTGAWRDGLVPVLTPHSGEFAYMTGSSTESSEDRVTSARRWSAAWKTVLVLKGAPTVIAHPDGRTVVSSAGGSELATAGTGDVLAGMVTGLLAMGLDPFEAAVCATHLGGAASEDFVRDHGRQSLMASDLVRRLPRLLTRRFRL
ncbi:MAG: NAD(P)H-hydrate dehydratase [Rhodothermales bacterium]|nr:NAD(P)H-hydrate dehydratase [Rhodothermales bacterium]